MDIDVMESAPDDKAFIRRRLLGIGLGGAAISLLPFLSGRASATTPPNSTSDTTPAATTTTAPPKRPTDDDVSLLGFAQTVELAARHLYDVALGTNGLFDEVQRAVIATIRESHDAYAAALSGMLGREAPQAVNPIFDELKASFSGKLADTLDAAYGLESTAVATHTEILGKLQGTDGAALIASILIVEARHGTVLASLNGSTDLDDLLVNKEADALAPAEG
ncbi:MAG TPA: ferritin-like domain-containing protein [Ilumatobacteraceae bacterium]|nr:ferritin-like domain-containing protein [Ilumatobacteraceae bacterium]